MDKKVVYKNEDGVFVWSDDDTKGSAIKDAILENSQLAGLDAFTSKEFATNRYMLVEQDSTSASELSACYGKLKSLHETQIDAIMTKTSFNQINKSTTLKVQWYRLSDFENKAAENYL